MARHANILDQNNIVATMCPQGSRIRPRLLEPDKPAQRATACSPGRVREPWVGSELSGAFGVSTRSQACDLAIPKLKITDRERC